MVLISFFLNLFADVLPGPQLPSPSDLKLYGGIGGGALAVVFLFLIFRRKKKHDPEAGLAEDLGEYPPPPRPGKRRLLVQGSPMRLRLVVVAPVGKKDFAKGGDVEPILDEVVPGLADIAEVDKPRVRVWPAQLTVPGFPPSFWRLTEKPSGQAGNWVLVAGAARANGQPVLLGLALWTDKPTKKGQLVLEPNQWSEALRVE